VSTVYLRLEDLIAAGTAAIAPAELLVRDIGLLESALARPRATAFGDDAYATIHLKAAALMESLARNHALIDGNKRIAWVATRLFLVLNGEDVRVPSPTVGDEFVRALAQGQLSIEQIADALIEWRVPL
jgi:death-on-curing protein